MATIAQGQADVEIDLIPAMIQAGVKVLSDWYDLTSREFAESLAEQVFQEMVAAASPSHRPAG
jgi:hypothetical protein